MKTFAWHFVGDKLRDGRDIPADGEWLIHGGPVVPCKFGLHASKHPLDALMYAPGSTLCLVELAGKIVPHNSDKVVASERKIIARKDVTGLLRNFARIQARSVLDLWNAPKVVRKYLITGDESTRDEARNAPWSASTSWDAASLAAWEATSTKAWEAARGAMQAAREATLAATWEACKSARENTRNEFQSLVHECFEGPLTELGVAP